MRPVRGRRAEKFRDITKANGDLHRKARIDMAMVIYRHSRSGNADQPERRRGVM